MANLYYHDPNYKPSLKKKKNISKNTINEILKRIDNGEKVSHLAKEYDINPATIYRYKNKRGA